MYIYVVFFSKQGFSKALAPYIFLRPYFWHYNLPQLLIIKAITHLNVSI